MRVVQNFDEGKSTNSARRGDAERREYPREHSQKKRSEKECVSVFERWTLWLFKALRPFLLLFLSSVDSSKPLRICVSLCEGKKSTA